MAAGFLTALGRRPRRGPLGRHAHPPTRSTPPPSQAMAEVGIDIPPNTPKILTADAVETSDVVITMGCGDTCPVFPGSYRDWDLTDPAGKGIDAVRPIRDDIRKRVAALLDELVGARP